MMTKAIGKADAVGEMASSSMKLMHGKTNNFMHWKVVQTVVCIKLFGKQANVMKNNVPYVVPAVELEDYTPLVPEGGVQINNAQIALLRMEAEKTRNKVVARFKESATVFFITLWDSTSVESQEVIRQHPDFEDADLRQDPNILWAIILETHLTNMNGGGDEMRVFDRIQLERNFNSFSQRNLTVGVFKTQFTEFRRTLTGAGVAESTEQELAAQFLSKLDMNRYGSMMTDLTNQAMRGIPMPQTLADAYTVAANWRVSKSAAVSGDMQSVFTFADDAPGRIDKGSDIEKVKDRENGRGHPWRGGGRGGRNDGRGRANNRTGRNSARGNGNGNRNSDARGGGRNTVSGRGANAGGVEYRTCRICLQKGHLAKDCPDNEDRVMMAIGEDDEADEDAIYESNFVVTPKCACPEDFERAFFTATEVLLEKSSIAINFSEC